MMETRVSILCFSDRKIHIVGVYLPRYLSKRGALAQGRIRVLSYGHRTNQCLYAEIDAKLSAGANDPSSSLRSKPLPRPSVGSSASSIWWGFNGYRVR